MLPRVTRAFGHFGLRLLLAFALWSLLAFLFFGCLVAAPLFWWQRLVRGKDERKAV